MAEDLLVAVLAAGQARRFGGGKIVADCARKPLLQWALEAAEAAGLPPGVIVTAPDFVEQDWVEAWQILPNEHAAQGLGSSVALAARAGLDGGYSRLLIVLGDMPLVEPDYFAQLAKAQKATATRYPHDGAGVPALLDRELMEQAAQLTGERGAGALLRSAALLDAPAGSLIDVDVPEDLARASRILLR